MEPRKRLTLLPVFVDTIPARLIEGCLYISESYGTAIHRSACGCGEETVTPLGPGGWTLTKDGDGAVSLSPSIGNFQFSCRSHYFITDNRVEWC